VLDLYQHIASSATAVSLSGNDFGQVVHTNKQYNLVLAKGRCSLATAGPAVQGSEKS